MSKRMSDEQEKYRQHLETLEDNKMKVISAALAQCDEGIQRAIERSDNYQAKKGDLYWVLQTI